MYKPLSANYAMWFPARDCASLFGHQKAEAEKSSILMLPVVCFLFRVFFLVCLFVFFVFQEVRPRADSFFILGKPTQYAFQF